MPGPYTAKHFANGAALLCAAFALSACASGAGMFVAGNDGGPSGFQDEAEDGAVDEGFSEQASDGQGAQILAASGNSLLPLPTGFRSGPPALASTGGGPNLVTANIGSSASTPLLGATLGGLTAASPGISVTVLGGSPVAVAGGTVGATTTGLVSTTTAATNTLVSNVSGAVRAVTTSPITSMTPGTVPLPAVLSLLTRPAGL